MSVRTTDNSCYIAEGALHHCHPNALFQQVTWSFTEQVYFSLNMLKNLYDWQDTKVWKGKKKKTWTKCRMKEKHLSDINARHGWLQPCSLEKWPRKCRKLFLLKRRGKRGTRIDEEHDWEAKIYFDCDYLGEFNKYRRSL